MFSGTSVCLEIEFAGTVAGAEHDQLVLTGDIRLAGTLCSSWHGSRGRIRRSGR
jgi:hypothetical protein